ncbi:MAG: hypothetical protein Q4C49_06680 [Bacillota bacterium]|nr:hypothetical protein [Bacillota bacterium]
MSAVMEFVRAALPWLIMGLLLAIYFGTSHYRKENNYGLIGMCLGMCLGVALKGIFGNIGISMVIGIMAGTIFGSLIEKKG